MKKIRISNGWELTTTDFKGVVDLPNDYVINLPRTKNAAGGASNGFFGDGKGIYKKYFKIPFKRLLLKR